MVYDQIQCTLIEIECAEINHNNTYNTPSFCLNTYKITITIIFYTFIQCAKGVFVSEKSSRICKNVYFVVSGLKLFNLKKRQALATSKFIFLPKKVKRQKYVH